MVRIARQAAIAESVGALVRDTVGQEIAAEVVYGADVQSLGSPDENPLLECVQNHCVKLCMKSIKILIMYFNS